MGIDDIIGGGINLVNNIINTAFPTPEAKASAEAKVLQAQADTYVAQFS